MKQIIINMKRLMLLAIATAGLVSCNKEEIKTKAVSIQIRGYNIGNSELEISLDALVYDKFKTEPDKQLNFSKVYTYPSTQGQASLKIKDVISGKEVYQNQLSLNTPDLERFFPFVFINGNPLEIKAPAADPSTNKMAFYIYYPQSNDAIDIFMRNEAGETVYIAKNVKPATWTYADYVTTEGFKDTNKDYTWYFVKAGTTDQWAFNDSEWMSQAGTSLLYIPKQGETGRVQTYFVTPAGNQLDAISLFKI
ncbi:hypothetical protein BFS30_12010 [Pedobacter steynii]|uniref:DUF4397 domain-containing protein n=2 Tax=Pedobacter steynii TaxID=430522 RepID=A0A1D7QGN9_9SPHI|nr:hypothetical protein BFS30_12010 [Pedobacter steynii]